MEKKGKETRTVPRVAEVIDIPSSSDEELALPKPVKHTDPKPTVLRGKAQAGGSRGRPGKRKGDVSIIDLSD
jgi:hypothetical protein